MQGIIYATREEAQRAFDWLDARMGYPRRGIHFTQILEREGFGFALPVDPARTPLNELAAVIPFQGPSELAAEWWPPPPTKG